jgi:Bacterial Ig domain
VKIFRQVLLVLAILAVSVRPGIAQPTVQAPVANPPATLALNEATRTNPTTLTGTLTGTDPNGASLTFRLSTPPSHGSVTVNSSGSFTYKLDPEYIGADSFGFIVNNGSLDSAEATVAINVIPGNDPPNAYPIYATIPPNGILYGQLLGDEIEDDMLAYSTYSIVSQPHNGTVTVDPNFGQFLYTPNSNVQSGTTDSFTYTVYDGAVYSLPATVSIVIGSDSVGFIADTVITNVEGADLVNVPVYSPASVSGAAVDEAVDRANQRLYVLTANALNVYDITAPIGAIQLNITLNTSVTLGFTAERIALSLDGRTAYIGSKDQVTAINLYPEYVASKGFMPAYTYLRTYSFPNGVPAGRDVAAMGVHPAGDRLYVVIDMDPASKKLNINNNLLLSDAGNGTTAAQALATAKLTDYGFLTYLDISSDLSISQANQTPAKFVTPFNLMNLSSGIAVLDIRKIAFSPDGNYALICGVGAQSPRITPFGVMPTSDLGTGGTLVVDVRRYTDQSMSTPPVAVANPYLGFIPDTEYGENTAALRLQIVQKGATIIHPDVLAAGLLLSAAQSANDVSLSAGASGLGLLPDTLAALDDTSAAYDVLWQTYQDYGNMQAYFDLYPRNMVGASGVAINHTGDFGVVTMEDTNNLGLLKLSLTKQLSGYSPGSPLVDDAGNPSFNIARGTGKTVNGFDAALDGAAPTKTFSEWAYPQAVAFTSDDSRIFIGMANGGPTPNKSNQAGTADALHLKTARDDPNSVFLSNSPPPGYVLAGNGGFESPRLATTLQNIDSSHDSLSDQVKAYNRWNALRPLSQIPQALQAKVASTDVAHLTIPGTVFKSDPTIPDSLNVGFFLPLSGIGYRLNTFGMPADTTNVATRGVVAALEQIGVLWNQLYHNPGYQPPTGSQPLPDNLPKITRPYFIIGLLSQPGGGIIQNQAQEALTHMPGTGNEADFPYLKLNSDEAFNFVPSAGPSNPTDNTGETKVGFDEPNTEALIRLLLSDLKVTKIELDPYPLALMPPDVQSDFRLIPHGNRTDPNSRRDLSNHMHVTFSDLHVDLSIDADNRGVITDSPAELAAKNQTNGEGKYILPNTGFIGDINNLGIPDYADGYDLFSGNYRANASTTFAPMIIRFPDDVDLKTMQFSLTYDESDPSQVTQVPNPAYISAGQTPNVPQFLYNLPPTGSYRIWTKDGPQARHEAGIDVNGDFIASGTLYSVSDLLKNDPPNQGTDRSVTVYIESVIPGASAAAVTINVTPNAGAQSSIATTLTDTVHVSGFHMGLAVDANGDGVIKLPNEDNSDVVTDARPFRFWVNDDNETGGTTPDYAGNVVNGADDLKDFFPVYLDLKLELLALPPSASVKYILKQEDSALNFVYTNLTRATAFSYKNSTSTTGFGPNFNQPAASATTQQITAAGVELSAVFLTQVVNQDAGVLLIDGRAASAKPLMLSIVKDGVEVAALTLPLLQFDVHYDADNTTVDGYPDPTKGDLGPAERTAQLSSDLETYPGVRTFVNWIDVYSDGVIGYADGIDKFGNGHPNACWKFEPFLIEVATLQNFPNAKFVFSYSGSDPDQMTMEGSGPTASYVLPSSNYLRIWTKDGDQVREPQSADNGGDFVNPGQAYTAQQLGWQPGDQYIRLYIEAVNLPQSGQTMPISVKFFPDGSVGVPNTFQATVNVQIYYISTENPGIDNMGF